MLCCFECGAGQSGMLRHRSENQNQIDLGRTEDFFLVGCKTLDTQFSASSLALRRASAGQRDFGQSFHPQLVDLRAISAQHITATDNADAHRLMGRFHRHDSTAKQEERGQPVRTFGEQTHSAAEDVRAPEMMQPSSLITALSRADCDAARPAYKDNSVSQCSRRVDASDYR